MSFLRPGVVKQHKTQNSKLKSVTYMTVNYVFVVNVVVVNGYIILSCSGFIETDMTSELPEKELHHIQNRIPLKRLGQPSDVADMALFLLQASYITGQVNSVHSR